MGEYCMDDRHGTPCPLPCLACTDECNSDAEGARMTSRELAFPLVNQLASPGAWGVRGEWPAKER